VYNKYIYLKKGPYVKTVIYNTAANAAAPLWGIYVIYVFQFSLGST